MADKFIAVPTQTIARKEVRCHACILRNNLDKPADDPVAKCDMTLHRFAEPQDADGTMVAPREPMGEVEVDLADALQRSFTAAGITATGGQIMALLNEVIDYYKAIDV